MLLSDDECVASRSFKKRGFNMNNMARSVAHLAIGVIAFTATALAGVTEPVGDAYAEQREWKFNVYLDDSRIGHHNFHLAKQEDTWLLTTEAEFEVKFLVFTAYRYRHSNQEVWRGDCLQKIESNTDVNGTPFAVSGARDDSGFTVETDRFRDELGDCIKTFAYWNPEVLNESELLNSQTGELLPISVEKASNETLMVRGQAIPAVRYHLVARGMELDIWYSSDQRWLALESTVKGGRKLRYELT
jgi:hypothetical protein